WALAQRCTWADRAPSRAPGRPGGDRDLQHRAARRFSEEWDRTLQHDGPARPAPRRAGELRAGRARRRGHGPGHAAVEGGPMSERIRTLIVDDEPLARLTIRQMLA